MAVETQTPAASAGGNGRASDQGAIRIRGARMHNLQNVDVDIPRDQLVVLTGPSGSGKSSLAFDTLYAEGQRQYIESLSVYARQFIHQMERPEVDCIDGLQPTICIDQRPGTANPRSTVATVTEIYDYLRVLMARAGDAACYECGAPIRPQTAAQILDAFLSLPEGAKAMLLASRVRGRRGGHQEEIRRIRKAGFVRARVDGVVYDIDQLPELNPRQLHDVEAVVDRVIVRESVRARLADSLQLALRHGDGIVIACYLDPERADADHPRGRWQDRLFSTRHACPQCERSFPDLEPRTFSFNSPYGACSRCDGLGKLERFDPALVIPDEAKSLDQGAVAPWKGLTAATVRQQMRLADAFLREHGASSRTRWDQLDRKLRRQLLEGDGQRFSGLLTMLEKRYVTETRAARRTFLAGFRRRIVCPECQGSRLRPEANAVRLGGHNVQAICRMAVGEAAEFFARLEMPAEKQPISDPLITEIRKRLAFLIQVGADYLTLDRAADTLSGGERQRVRLATSIGSALVGVCYVLDEPSIGLHPRDNRRLIEALRDLQREGNTVLVVEHDEAMMRAADQVIDIGPGAGSGGGQIVAQGRLAEILNSPHSITARYLNGAAAIPVPAVRRPIRKTRRLILEAATTNNLQAVDAQFPLGVLVCVTGVSGSGKSSLINQTLGPALIRRFGGSSPEPGEFRSLRGTGHIDKVIQIDQTPIGRTPRSTPATYSGAFDEIRRAFARTRAAKQRGYRAGRFSFNVKGGRCEHCLGHGLQKIEMNFLPDLYVTCHECGGARFNHQTLEIRYRNKTIADVLDMSVAEARDFFENFAEIHRLLSSLDQVGLGYLSLGQPSTTLSGGEAQRIKLAVELARVDTGKTLYLLDEPTTGLHFDDIRRLLTVLGELVDRGNTVIIIEHHLDVIKTADWIIDLGPEGGQSGGRVVASGRPEQIAALPDNHTGRFLRPLLAR